MQKILIVEDDIDIQDILKNHLIDGTGDSKYIGKRNSLFSKW